MYLVVLSLSLSFSSLNSMMNTMLFCVVQPVQIASRFCGLMGETLDDQLTRFPESHDAISEAKKKCVEFERALIKDAMKRMAGTEIDVRSWTKVIPRSLSTTILHHHLFGICSFVLSLMPDQTRYRTFE